MRLADLPAHRQDALLWQYALELDYDEVDDLVRESDGKPCRWRMGPSAAEQATAVLGDDGRYHLLLDGKLTCRPSVRAGRSEPPDTVTHEQWCFWWTDGSVYRIQAPIRRTPTRTVPRGRNRTVRWLVRLTDVVVDAALVPLQARCALNPREGWPAHVQLGTAMGDQRALLVAELGPLCNACGRRSGSFVDHDHFTGLVRGLLCVHCNTWIDRCPHLTGCPWGDYLNQPPAARLNLRYPRPERAGRSDRAAAKIEYLGFDPLYRGPGMSRR